MEDLARQVRRLDRTLGRLSTGANVHRVANLRCSLSLGFAAYRDGLWGREALDRMIRQAHRFLRQTPIDLWRAAG